MAADQRGTAADEGLHLSRFYYGDERKADGSAAFSIDGDAHAKHYLQLAQNPTQEHWLQTFVKGKGYQDFSWQSKP